MIKRPIKVCPAYKDSIRDADDNLVFIGANDHSKKHHDFAEFVVTAVEAYEANQALIKQLVEALNEARSEILQLKNARWSEAEGSDDDWVAGYDEALAAARKAGF